MCCGAVPRGVHLQYGMQWHHMYKRCGDLVPLGATAESAVAIVMQHMHISAMTPCNQQVP